MYSKLTEFIITDEERKLINNDLEFRKQLSDFLGEKENAQVVSDLMDAAKYYTNDGKDNNLVYSFRLKDICIPSLFFGFFTLIYRSSFLMAGILFGIIFVIDTSTYIKFLKYVLGYSIFGVWALVWIYVACFYRFLLLKDFFQKYLVMPIAGYRQRRISSIITAIVAYIAAKILWFLFSIFAAGTLLAIFA